MPIHEFGPLKKIEDAEKEVEEGKAKEIRKGVSIDANKQARQPGENKRLVPKETLRTQEKSRQDRAKKDEQVVKKIRKTETKKTQATHPLIHGTLEIEEEEL